VWTRQAAKSVVAAVAAYAALAAPAP